MCNFFYPWNNQKWINLFSTNVPLLYPLKISENRSFSNVFREYRCGTLAENGLTYCFLIILRRVVVNSFAQTPLVSVAESGKEPLTLLWWKSLSYSNLSIDLPWKSMDWFLYDEDLRHARVTKKKISSAYK